MCIKSIEADFIVVQYLDIDISLIRVVVVHGLFIGRSLQIRSHSHLWF